jgi:hypothetical protein
MDPLVKSVIVGIVAAAAVDFQAFRTWDSVEDAKTYAWKVAAWRWLLGAITGLVAGLGLGAL